MKDARNSFSQANQINHVSLVILRIEIDDLNIYKDQTHQEISQDIYKFLSYNSTIF
jgi:hypothetical protein